jgi:hypothetical protein
MGEKVCMKKGKCMHGHAHEAQAGGDEKGRCGTFYRCGCGEDHNALFARALEAPFLISSNQLHTVLLDSRLIAVEPPSYSGPYAALHERPPRTSLSHP